MTAVEELLLVLYAMSHHGLARDNAIAVARIAGDAHAVWCTSNHSSAADWMWHVDNAVKVWLEANPA